MARWVCTTSTTSDAFGLPTRLTWFHVWSPIVPTVSSSEGMSVSAGHPDSSFPTRKKVARAAHRVSQADQPLDDRRHLRADGGGARRGGRCGGARGLEGGRRGGRVVAAGQRRADRSEDHAQQEQGDHRHHERAESAPAPRGSVHRSRRNERGAAMVRGHGSPRLRAGLAFRDQKMGRADRNRAVRGVELGYRCTTGQVSVRVIPSTAWILATTSFPRSSTLRASARTITSYGPVTSSAAVTPLIWATSLATCAALPTSVWMRM